MPLRSATELTLVFADLSSFRLVVRNVRSILTEFFGPCDRRSRNGSFVVLDGVALANPIYCQQRKARRGKVGFRWLFAVLVHGRHLEMMLQGGERFAGPILQLRIVAALRIALE